MKASRPPKVNWRDRREFWRTWNFWTEAFAWDGSATPRVIARVAVAGLVASLVTLASRRGPNLALPVGSQEIVGTVLMLLLVLRTNAGYERWWESRRLGRRPARPADGQPGHRGPEHTRLTIDPRP